MSIRANIDRRWLGKQILDAVQRCEVDESVVVASDIWGLVWSDDGAAIMKAAKEQQAHVIVGRVQKEAP
jgi:hypothetical protein